MSWFTEKLGFVVRAHIGVPGQNAPCVVHTDACQGTGELLGGRGVVFHQESAKWPYGTEAVFADLHGNRYALLQADNLS